VRQKPETSTTCTDRRWRQPQFPRRPTATSCFGILALLTDFITRDDLIAAMRAWSVAKHRSLEDFLVDRADLDLTDRDQVRPMVDLCFSPSFETQVASRP
jgi:hypothetical protein